MNFLSRRIILITVFIVLIITLIHGILLFDYYLNVWNKRTEDIKDSLAKVLYLNKDSFISNTILQQNTGIEMLRNRLKKSDNIDEIQWDCNTKPDKALEKKFTDREDSIILEQNFEIPNGQNCKLSLSKKYTPLLKSTFLRNQILFIIISSLVLILFIAFSVHWIIKRYLQRPVNVIFSAINKLSDKEYEFSKLDTNNPEFNTIIEKLRILGLIIKEDKKELESKSKLASIGQTSAMLAHDVRKPFSMLRSVLNMIDVLKNDPAGLANAKKEIEKAVRNVESMLNDIMDFSREVNLETKPSSLTNIFDFAIRQTSQSYQECDITFEYNFNNSTLPLLDQERVARVFSNILSNAIEAITVIGKKDTGKITISVNNTVSEDGSSVVEIVIGNDGPPLKEEDIPNIFESFFTKGKKKGTGLGLASAHKIVKLHKGNICAKNRINKDNTITGVEFVIRVPASNILSYPASPSEVKIDNLPKNIKDAIFVKLHNNVTELESTIGMLNKEGKKFNILLLEDETLYRASIKSTVKKNDQIDRMVTIYDAHTVEEALKLLEAVEITHAIVDIDLGEIKNGFDFLSIVQENKYNGLQCMVHSNRHLDEYREKAKKLGAVMFVPKPLNIEHLVLFLSGKAQKHILYADDESLMRKFIPIKIEQALGDSYIIETFENAETLLVRIKELGSCTAVLTDQNMGDGMKGTELIKELKNLKIVCKKIIISNMPGEEFVKEAKSAGADFVLNPALIEIEDIIESLLN